MGNKRIYVLSTASDRDALQPVLESLKAKGVSARDDSSTPQKNDTILAVLSEAFYADENCKKQLLDLVSTGAENVLPLQLDAAAIPDELKNALYSRNIIPASERDADQIAERIVSAIPKKKNYLPLILIIAAVVIAAVMAIIIWRIVSSKPEPETGVETAPPVSDITIPDNIGITTEDLARIEDVVIVGDRFEYYTDSDFREKGKWLWANEDIAYRSFETGEPVWISMEDGHSFELTHYDDLHFLEMMPNLRFVDFVNVEASADALPNLKNASLLEKVSIRDCNIDGFDWFSGSTLKYFDFQGTQYADFSPLTDCTNLKEAYIDLRGMADADFSGFAPPALESINIDNGEMFDSVDLSGMAGCSNLKAFYLANLPVRNVSFLTGMSSLERLVLFNLDELTDITPVGQLTQLKDLEIDYCQRITDYFPIAGCTALEKIYIQGDDNPDAIRDASFLSDLPKIHDIGLYSCNLNNMDFLEGVADNGYSVNLGFAGDILDYSGIASIARYGYMHINPRYHDGGEGGEFTAVLPFIQNVEIDFLMLYECADVDLAQLPDGIHELSIVYGNLASLDGMKAYSLRRLELYGCQYLRSLSGMENISTLYGDRGQMELEIVECPRLTDFSVLNSVRLSGLKLIGMYSLPEFDKLTFEYLRLESIEDMNDLNVLNALPEGQDYESMEFVGFDELSDLSPLRRFKINHLAIPPQVAEQAEELKEDGIIKGYEISFPDGSWNPLDIKVELLSLDELATLPKSLLRRVEEVSVVGDRLVNMRQYDVIDDWENQDENGIPAIILRDRATDEEIPVGPGTIDSLDIFSELTGLKNLILFNQPLSSLDGIQGFAELNSLQIRLCRGITDASPAFACVNLRDLAIDLCPIDSIQGVQNLNALSALNLNETNVTDLSPLSQLDTGTAAAEEGGFRLYINNLECSDYSALGTFPLLENLDINDTDAALYVSHLVNTDILRFAAANSFRRDGMAADANALFAEFVHAHPELTELWIPANEGITDLSPVLELEDLRFLCVSNDMEAALASLQGTELPFELEITD